MSITVDLDNCGHTGDWSVYEGQCYSCKSDQVPWHSARSSCSQLGAHLVTITNSGIQPFLQNLCINASFWIGLNDLSIEGTFIWDDMSTPVSYLNWAPGEPNNAGDEDCVHVSEPSMYQWNDEGCDWSFSYICQRPKDIDDCSQDPCQNNGTCTDLVNHFQCDCVPGYNGTTCENMINECLPDLCQNNGTCTDLVNDYRCDCIPGFNGTNCENDIDDCQAEPCQNNGTCTDLANDYQCDCAAGFNGTNCENNFDDCSQGPCQNNGTCTDLVNGYQCDCVPGFNGTNCQNDIDDCSQDPCQNNGTCSDLVNHFQCDCVPGYNGTTCENIIITNSTDGCSIINSQDVCSPGYRCHEFNNYTVACIPIINKGAGL